MRRADPRAVTAALATLVAISAAAPASEPARRQGGAESVRPPAPTAAAPDPASFRLGYVSRDRPTLVAAVPGGRGEPVLGAAAGDADFDADARADVVVWVSRRAAPGGAHLDGDLFLLAPGRPPTRLTDDPAMERHPAVSPDGRRVAFTSDRAGNDDIWVLDVSGGAPRQLTDHPGADTWPTWSPDGRTLAFSSTRDDPAGDVYTVPAGGGAPRRLTDHPGADTQPAWSPDGRLLAFTTTRFRSPAGPAPDAPAPVPSAPAPTGAPSTPAPTRAPSPSAPVPARSTPPAAASTAPAAPAPPSPAAAPLSDVVTMAVTGGPVTRAVPSGYDSAEAAWAPDGRRLAFVSVRADPAGDVYVVDGGAVTPVAASATRAEREPTWRGAQVVHTSVAVHDTTDVWSADATGGDRRDRTARPDLDENGPAYTADGRLLAYSAAQPGGGERIVVADADGANPRVLAPPGTQPGDRDTDPTWSPDGTMLAFARHPAAGGADTGGGDVAAAAVDGRPASRVLVVRAADAALVGELPVPAHLYGDDEQPAWSPSGDRLAVARRTAERFSRVEPPRVDQPLPPGRALDQAKTVLTPEIPATPEIVFFIDSTASMGGVIDGLKTTIVEVVRRVQSSQPNARFALIAYGAHEAGEIAAGRYYRRLSGLIGGDGADQRLADALQPLQAQNGGTEGWYNAIVQAFQGDDAHRVDLRPGSSPIVVLIGDAPSQGNTRHPPGASSEPVTQQEVIELMQTLRARLVAVPVQGQGELGLDWDDPADPDQVGEATEIAQATGGVVTATTRDDEVARAVVDGITSTRVTVTPTVDRCDDGLDVAFEPAAAEVVSGQRARFTERIRVAAGAAPGTVLRCTVGFDVGSPVAPGEVRQEITIRVTAPDLPLVRVDDVTVRATGPDGARVTYQATATTPDGQPLPTPVCTPPSGSVFPVGQTVVSCTASVRGGPPGRDIAVITVTDPAAEGRRIWVARIAATGPETVTFDDQHDLSARVDAPCRARGTRGDDPGDRAPAWSPDGAALAFTDSAGPRAGLCVVDADGGRPRTPVSPADQGDRDLADPAWSPDGAGIAVTRAEDDASPTLLTVPAGGGPATVVVHTVGGAAQPAYQVLPERDLAVTGSVAGQPAYVGGEDIVVTFVVRNTSPRAATNVFLSPTLPAELAPPSRADPRCDTAALVCRLGTLGVGDQTTVTIALAARAAVVGAVTGRVTAMVGTDRPPITRQTSMPLVVRQPTLTVTPAIGPPGFVTRAVGTDFPPGAVVRLTWEKGITATPDTVVVGPDGTFRTHKLIMRKDPLGPRMLRAELVSGRRFAAVRSERAFLVVPRHLAPPLFGARR